MKGNQLDITSPAQAEGEKAAGASTNDGQRRFLGVHFACCDIYSRVYLNREGTQYQGNCPRCGRQVRFQVGPGGTDARFFTAY